MTTQATILAFETATSACSVALQHAGKVSDRFEIGNNIHSKRVLSMARQLLDETEVSPSQLDAVAVGQGPGSFTGLRIGVGVAQGIAYGASCQMLGVSSLATLAAQSEQDGIVLAGIDARMHEIYWGLYQKQGDQVTLLGQHQVTAPNQVPLEQAITLVGNAWQEYRSDFVAGALERVNLQEEVIYPQARFLLGLAAMKYADGETISPIDFAPEYVRNSVAKKARPRKTSG